MSTSHGGLKMRSLLAPNNHQQFGNLVTLPLLLITLIFTPIHQAQAKPFDFFPYDWDSNNALVVFNYKAGDIETLHSASLIAKPVYLPV